MAEAIYKVQDPQGNIREIAGPEGASDADVIAQAQRLFATEAAPSSPADRIPGVKPERKQTGDIVSSSIIRGVSGLAGLPVDALNLLRAARNKAQGTQYPGFTGGSADIVKGIESVTGTPLYRPETSGERMAASVIEGAASGGPFGRVGALIGGISGAGGEIGERITGGPGGRIAGSLLAGGGAGILSSVRRPTGSVLNDLLDETDPRTLDAAQRLINDARRQGITLTGPEAIAQARGSATEPLLGIQRVVEQSRGGGPTMAATMAARPEQNRAAFQGILGRIGPQVADPTDIAPRVQQAAEATITQARQAGNQAAAGLYAAAGSQRVPASTWNSITSNPAIADALARVRNNPLLGLQNEQVGSVRWLDAAKKYLDELAQPSMGASALERTGASAATRAASDLRTSVDQAVPAYRQARGIVEQNIRQNVEPLQRQPIGQLAEATTFPAQRAILFPANPETLTPQAVRQTIGRLRVQDPTAARDLTRQFLETQFDEVTQGLVSGGNAMGGAKFAAAITGNTKQAQNIRAAVESVGGRDALTGFNRFIQIMEAQGKRQAGGSMTEFNKQITEELSRGGIAGGAASTAASPGKLLTAASDWWQRFQYGGNTRELADIFTDPQSVERMRRLAMLNPGTERAQAIAAVIAASNVPQREQ